MSFAETDAQFAYRRKQARALREAGPCPFKVGDRVRGTAKFPGVQPMTIARVECSVRGNWMLIAPNGGSVLAYMVEMDND